MCLVCHKLDSGDPETGYSVDMKVMIHKGAELDDVARVQEMRGLPYRPNGDNYKTKLGRDVCGSFHDNIGFETGENHGLGLPKSSDGDCSSCHQANLSSKFGASIPGVNVIEARAPSLLEVKFEILSVTIMAPGEYPPANYTITEDNGDPIRLDEMREWHPIRRHRAGKLRMKGENLF